MKTKVVSLIVSFIFLVASVGTSLAAEVSVPSSSKNFSTVSNSMKDAKSISLDTYYNGTIFYYNTDNFYKFSLDTSGRVKVNLNSDELQHINCYIYDSNGDYIWGYGKDYDYNK